jgi:hypothetical protein
MKEITLKAIKKTNTTSMRYIQFFSTTNDIYLFLEVLFFSEKTIFLSYNINLIISESQNSKKKIFYRY